MTYKVFTFTSYAAAVKSAVSAVARYHRPVGILAWAGGHARSCGYQVYGQNPATSSNFTVRYVYPTDPSSATRCNARISYISFFSGALKYRLRKYRQTDEPARRSLHMAASSPPTRPGTAGTSSSPRCADRADRQPASPEDPGPRPEPACPDPSDRARRPGVQRRAPPTWPARRRPGRARRPPPAALPRSSCRRWTRSCVARRHRCRRGPTARC